MPIHGFLLRRNRHEEILLPIDVVTQVTIESEVRDGLLAECSGLSGLVEWLDSIARIPGLAELDHRLKDPEINLSALKS